MVHTAKGDALETSLSQSTRFAARRHENFKFGILDLVASDSGRGTWGVAPPVSVFQVGLTPAVGPVGTREAG